MNNIEDISANALLKSLIALPYLQQNQTRFFMICLTRLIQKLEQQQSPVYRASGFQRTKREKRFQELQNEAESLFQKPKN